MSQVEANLMDSDLCPYCKTNKDNQTSCCYNIHRLKKFIEKANYYDFETLEEAKI